MRILRFALVACFAMGLSACSGNSGKTGPEDGERGREKLPVWEPDPKLMAQLAPYTNVGPYQVRPPSGYKRLKAPKAPAGLTIFTWASSPRTDGTRATFSVAIFTPPPGESLPGGLDKTTEALVDQLKSRRTDWSQAPKERGLIAGLEFRQVRWSGTDTTTSRKMHGFMYVAIIGKEAVQLLSQDVDPNHEPPLRLAEAAALTFQKQ